VSLRRALAALIVSTLALTACSSSGGRTFHAEFTRAIQVFPAVKVRVLGVAVGQVEDVRNGRNGVDVTFSITDPDIRLPSDVKAVIVPASLLGERYIQLLPAYSGGPQLPDGATIPLSRTGVPAEPDDLLRSLNDYMGGLDPHTVKRFVENAAQVLKGNGEDLNRLIEHGSSVISTLNAKREDLKTLIVELDKLTSALSTRQRGIADLIQHYNVVAHAVVDDRKALEGTISGLNQAALQLASLLIAHRQPLHQDIESLTRTGRTLSRNVNAFAGTGRWATRLFRAASRAADFNADWLRLNQQGHEIGALILIRLEQRLMELCQDSGSPQCSVPQYWAAHAPQLFCFKAVCPKPKGPASSALTKALKHNKRVKAKVTAEAARQGTSVRLMVKRLLDRTVGDPYRWMQQ
jgi:phospholipid/cholesterol/gamma-HCH transport system substrate-binding protein